MSFLSNPCALLLVAALATAAPPAKISERPSFHSLFDDSSDSFDVPFFSNFFFPMWKIFPDFSGLEPVVVSDPDKFQVTTKVVGYILEDLKVKVKGRLLSIQGQHHNLEDDRIGGMASQFYQTYSLPANATADEVTAVLWSNHWLTVTAKLGGQAPEDGDRREHFVSIEQSQEPYVKPGANVPEETTAAATTAADDHREETTTKDSWKDNDTINEVVPL